MVVGSLACLAAAAGAVESSNARDDITIEKLTRLSSSLLGQVVQRRGDELKLVWPQAGIDPAALEGWAFRHRLVQPLDDASAAANQQAALALAMERPGWRLSLQTHKLLGLR